MRKTLRNRFDSQLGGALAALIVAFITSEAQAQTSKAPKSSPRSEDRIVTSHDTPPPILIMEGSFIVEIRDPDFDESEIVEGQRKKYRHRPVVAQNKLYIAHVKIVDGSGEILYRGDHRRSGNDLSLTVTTASNDMVNLGPINNKLEISTSSNTHLVKSTGEDKPVGLMRKGRFRYRNDSGGADTRIQRVTVKRGSSVVFETDLSDVTSGGRELKVMIWLHEARP